MIGDRALALERALGLAYAQLNRRERTEHELREHLLKHDVPPEVQDQALVELRRDGYVDDERFARLLVQDKSDLEQWGSDRIRRALLGRGVSSGVAEAALQEAGQSGAPDELARALGVLERRFPQGLTGRRESERALGVLLRKGYEYELASDALSQHRRRLDAPQGSQRA